MLPYYAPMESSEVPSYDLLQVQYVARKGWILTSTRVDLDVMREGHDPDDIRDCFLQLEAADFHKAVPDDRGSGVMLDVYLPSYCGKQMYLKFKLTDDNRIYVLSFKRSTSR